MGNFFIWFQHRSGSSHLVSLLNSHPEIQCKGEVFGCFPIGSRSFSQNSANRLLGDNHYQRIINRFPGRIDDPGDRQCLNELEQYFGPDRSETADAFRIRGFKFKFPSQAKLFPEITNWLNDRRSAVSLIALNRKNLLRRALSVLNLKRIRDVSNQANLREPQQLPAVNFDVQEVVRLIEYYGEIAHEFEDWSNAFPHKLEIEYQDLIDNPEVIANQLQMFLGVNKTQPLKSSFQRITSDDLRAVVSNYDELQTALRKKGLDRFL